MDLEQNTPLPRSNQEIYSPDNALQIQRRRSAPIIEDGKTLDELIAGDNYWTGLAKIGRERGATDEEIWQDMKDW